MVSSHPDFEGVNAKTVPSPEAPPAAVVPKTYPFFVSVTPATGSVPSVPFPKLCKTVSVPALLNSNAVPPL